MECRVNIGRAQIAKLLLIQDMGRVGKFLDQSLDVIQLQCTSSHFSFQNFVLTGQGLPWS